MAYPGSITSLSALVDSHLSKTSILQNDNQSSESNCSSEIKLPFSNTVEMGTLPESPFLPCRRLPIPSISLSDSPTQRVLSQQILNMLKLKEQRKQEEKENLEKNMRKLKIEESDSDCVIDLMKAIQTPYSIAPSSEPEQKVLSKSSSCESIFKGQFIDCEEESPPIPEPHLPCKMDMSYILYEKIRMPKCSTFGKVLTSSIRRKAAPYLRETEVSNKK